MTNANTAVKAVKTWTMAEREEIASKCGTGRATTFEDYMSKEELTNYPVDDEQIDEDADYYAKEWDDGAWDSWDKVRTIPGSWLYGLEDEEVEKLKYWATDSYQFDIAQILSIWNDEAMEEKENEEEDE